MVGVLPNVESNGVPSLGAPFPAVSAKVRPVAVQGMRRARLHAKLDQVWQQRLGLVVAPAGAGKSTLLACYAAGLSVPTAWFRAEPGDGEVATFLGYLAAATRAALGPLPSTRWTSVADAARALEGWSGSRALLVVDDVHELAGSPAERALSTLIDYLPPNMALVLAGRSAPDINLPRRRVNGELVQLDAEDLRFRSWEVETLFRQFYRESLRPEDLAVLARKTEGWAAGLQLFHLATRDLAPGERRKVLHEVVASGRLFKEYLTANVLSQLGSDLRTFLIESAVAPRLSGAFCDELLGRDDSAELLIELERRRLFTIPLGGGWYRYHEVLRGALEATLLDRIGEAELRRRYLHVADLLQRAGFPAEALVAASRAGDTERVRQLLGANGSAIAERGGDWLEAVPAAVRWRDPWVLLADARRHRDRGQLPEAVSIYRRAEEAFGTLRAAQLCRTERLALQPWIEPDLPPPGTGLGQLRSTVARDPLAAAASSTGLEAGLALLLAGHADAATTVLTRCVDDPDASELRVAATRLVLGAARLLGGENTSIDIQWAIEHAERAGAAWLVELAQSVQRLSGRAAVPSRSGPDSWAGALGALCAGWACLRAGTPTDVDLDEAAAFFDGMGAGVLAAWCRAIGALAAARSGAEDAGALALRALEEARRAAVPGAALLAELALATVDRRSNGRVTKLTARLDRLGLRPDVAADTDRHARVRCLGGFEMTIGGAAVNVEALKPRSRSLLRFLAAAAGRPVHREQILAALWPDAGPDSATRTFHVALSSLRGLLEGLGGANGRTFIHRDGEAYRLDLGPGGEHDLVAFEEACGELRQARAGGGAAAVATACRKIVALHRGELLPEEGPAEWVVGPRESHREAAASAAFTLGTLLNSQGDPAGAAAACESALAIDRYRDDAWRLLISIHECAGNRASAARARQRYERILTTL